ncbi:hypothetical protein [Haloprofundus halobius]|uniref:hypothetical protein n=1 Tax=Haloprofundus halobius TaxID=2876194 RepID=UPI001CD0310E|nr:hypothetical protein [Haloprofundus halobius]
MIPTLLTNALSTVLQSGDYDCFAGGPDPACWIAPYTDQLGSVFVLFAVIIFGGGLAVNQRSPAPLIVVAVVVGAASITVLPALANRMILMLAIGGATAALFAFYQRFRR